MLFRLDGCVKPLVRLHTYCWHRTVMVIPPVVRYQMTATSSGFLKRLHFSNLLIHCYLLSANIQWCLSSLIFRISKFFSSSFSNDIESFLYRFFLLFRVLVPVIFLHCLQLSFFSLVIFLHSYLCQWFFSSEILSSLVFRIFKSNRCFPSHQTVCILVFKTHTWQKAVDIDL